MPCSMPAGKTALVLENRPDLFVAELIGESDHGRSRYPVLDHPEQFAFRPVSPQPMMMEVSGARI